MNHQLLCTLLAASTLAIGCEPIEDPENRVVWEPAYERLESNEAGSDKPSASVGCIDDLRLWNFVRDEEGRLESAQLFNGTEDEPFRTERYEYDEYGLSRYVTAGAGNEYTLTIVRDDTGRVTERQYRSSQNDRDTVERLIMETETTRVVEFEGRADWFLWTPALSHLDFERSSAVTEHLVDPQLIGLNLSGLTDLDIATATNVAEAFIDSEGEGMTMHIRQTIQLDEQGREVRVESEHLTGDQATSVRVTTFTVNDEGERTERSIDMNNDGEFEEQTVSVHSTAGLLISQEWSGREDGQPSNVKTETQYDGEGRVEVERITKNGQETIATHAYDGNLWSIDRVSDDTGRADRRTEVYLNDNGNRVLKREIDSRDEPPYYQKRYAYDESNRRVFDERDSNMNGEFNERWEYFYETDAQPAWELRIKPANAACSSAN